jgi:hypothetical protein
MRWLGRPSRLLRQRSVVTSEHRKEFEGESLRPNEEKQKAGAGAESQDCVYEQMAWRGGTYHRNEQTVEHKEKGEAAKQLVFGCLSLHLDESTRAFETNEGERCIEHIGSAPGDVRR